METRKKPATVQEYIDQFPSEAQKRLHELRAILKSVTPNSEEGLKWGVPAFSYQRILYTYAGFKKHIGFYPTPDAIKAFKHALKEYKTGKSSIQFPLEKPLPEELITQIALFRIKELKEKDARWM